MGLLVSALATGAYLIYVDVKREREVLQDLVKHQKRTLGRRLVKRLGLKRTLREASPRGARGSLVSPGRAAGPQPPERPEGDVDVEGPASPLASGRVIDPSPL